VSACACSGGIYSSTGCRARSAAGATWTCRSASAPWAARSGHTSVVDAAGAIYVIGGSGNTYYQDVWASTDGGADPTRAWGGRGVLEWGTMGFPRGYLGVLRGYEGVLGPRRGCQGWASAAHGITRGGTLGGILGGTIERSRCLGHSNRLHRGMLGGVLRGVLSTTRRVLRGYSGGTQGTLGVVGCTLGHPLTGLHARAFAELFGFCALVSDAFQFSSRCQPALNPCSIRL
jgi:hypothetical protein